jgi:hypothetical protein
MFHPDLNFDVARMRQDERIARAHRYPSARRRWFGRRAAPASRHLFAVPTVAHAPAGHDQRVA